METALSEIDAQRRSSNTPIGEPVASVGDLCVTGRDVLARLLLAAFGSTLLA
jgi:hypothetical protein